ncbi:transcriptional regulator [Parablastomonas sp. CN1-191]|uniref:transcriptional regulator n=1 Tax=Parablastomonas sp. CN1-191 TaxID=3400908 RepID=UPI003BF847E8
MSGLDPVIHPVTRLQIMGVLGSVSEMAFDRLRDIVQVSDSVLSKHLSALVEAGYVSLRKQALDGRQRTWVERTGPGRRAFEGHVAALQSLVGA